MDLERMDLERMDLERMSPEKMSLKRLQQIIESYGTNPDAWPEDERDEAVRLLELNRSSITGFDEQVELDALLDGFTISAGPDAQIIHRIMDQVQPTLLEHIVAWLTPGRDFRAYWRPALAMAMPLLLGFTLGMTLSLDLMTEEDTTWDEELYVLAITGDSNGEWFYE